MEKKPGRPPRWKQTEDEKRLYDTFDARRKDRTQLKSRRQKSLDTPIKGLGTLIGAYFKGDGQTLKKIEETRALLAWDVLVGESAARVSRALKIRGQQLIVKVSDPLWMSQLTLLKHDLVRKYQQEFPRLGITDIFFVR